MMDMPRWLLVAISVLVLAWPASCADPVLFPVAKDAATSLYTIPIRDGANHVIDLAGPLLWSTCAADHLPAKFTCQDKECKLAATAYRPPSCHVGGQQCTQQQQRCAAYPYNPVTRRCAAARLAHTRLVANTTDGANPLRQVSVRAVAACAPRKLLARLPRDAAGVAGLAASGLALPAQVAASQRVAGKFLLCLPRNAGGEGVAIFGGGPLFLMTSTAPPVEVASDFTSSLTYTPLVSRRGSSSYYLPVTAIAVDTVQVSLPKDALAGGVVLGTTAAYTELRPDVYGPVVGAFDRTLRRSWNNTKRVAAVAPFELCYDSKTLPGPTRIGWLVPEIVLVLEGGRKTNWTFGGLNTMVDVNGFTAACFGFVKMKPEKNGGYGGKPAVVLGGFQMEDHVLHFDLEKRRLGFARLPVFTSCSNFNFTRKG
ncbi:hypothetical protein HU200_064766 [Digitaria exilis]|uniref:Peptidase A1 domain-containing protein n=1 Tax=Digitaria exilis TaxID=1010633 RepID=A0A835A5C9_9POAL|nr:hypothetical protein HU200_064766 [Digitaria exilis]CAB3479381.1 unnamed protein product [Digitaria exilis]